MSEELRDLLESHKWLIDVLEDRITVLEGTIRELEQRIDRLEPSEYNSLNTYNLGK
jgi:hypothetical protein